MKTLTNGLAVQIIRIGEYLSAFGARGLLMALEHAVKFKLLGGGARSTTVPGFGPVQLRPRTSDLATFREIFVNGEYDARRHGLLPTIQRAYDEVLASGRRPLIIDAGANIGLASRFLTRFFPEADILLVEADESNAIAARRNCQGSERMRVVEAALWQRPGRISLTRSEDATTGRVSEGGGGVGGLEVEAVTMSALVEGREQDLFLVKMDIEGSEASVLTADAGWLSAAAPILMIEPHDGSMNAFGSLAGLLCHEDYRSGMIVLSGSTMIFVPRSRCEAMPRNPKSRGSQQAGD